MSGCLFTKVSRNGRLEFCSVSRVNFMLVCNLLRWVRNPCMCCFFMMAKMSSTWRSHTFGWWSHVVSAVDSKDIMNISATVEDVGAPMATPSV